MAKNTQRDDPEQSKAFIEKAREIEADEEKSAADELMKRLAAKKPEPRTSTQSSGLSESASDVPEGLREVMKANSLALIELTSKVRG